VLSVTMRIGKADRPDAPGFIAGRTYASDAPEFFARMQDRSPDAAACRARALHTRPILKRSGLAG
jgi:hypothetical protein